MNLYSFSRRIALAVACAGVLASCGSSGDPPTLRATQFGTVEGTDDSAGSGTYAWKGIAFASPPVGPLRWKAPVDPQPWSSTRPATQFANACVQYG
ncbi:MAG: carboxylesterase family protein, partial [Legionella sp.]|nr:carboxylesterase family protein [Legionella sp.]